MISYAAQGRFAAEFIAFLVAIAGGALVGLRAELLNDNRARRGALAAGFLLVAAVSFLEGSLIVTAQDNPVSLAARGVGVVLVALGSARWAGGRRSQRLLWLGLLWILLSIGLQGAGYPVGGDAALGIGATAIGISLRVASGRSIAARVAASSAVILLIVVLVLSVSLSAVLSTNVRDDAGRRLDSRALTEAHDASTDQANVATVVARNVGLTFATNAQFVSATTALVTGPDPNAGMLPSGLQRIFGLMQQYLGLPIAMAFVNSSGHVYGLAAPSGFDLGIVGAAVGSEAVKQAFAAPTQQQTSGAQAFGKSAFVVAVQTVQLTAADGTNSYPTAIVVIDPLDDHYLNTRRFNDRSVALAIVDRNSVLASSGATPPGAALTRLATRSLDSAGSPIPLTETEGQLLSVEPITIGTQPVAVMIATTSNTVVTDVRDKLLRTLFLLAMAGTLLALALAAYGGERVSGGIRVLTAAAQRIQGGNFAEPAGVTAEDEVGVLGAAFDSMALAISAQTGALQLAAEEEAALRSQIEAVVAGMGEALIAIDAEGHVQLFNRAAEELLGLDRDEVYGELVGDVLVAVGEDGVPLGQRLQRPSPARWMQSATVATELGPRIPVAISAGPLRSADGSVTGGVLVLRDLRPEREVDRVKSEFLSRIGHELRTPLTGILGYSEILLRRHVPAERAREMHQQIVDAGRRLYRVVQMLEFSAASEAGRSLLRNETISIRSVVDDAVAEWGTRVNGNHTIARRVGRRLPEVRGDRRWLAMAIDELIDNAVKFSPDGGPIGVTASVVDRDDDTRAVCVTVSDKGVGLGDISPSDIFGDFFQADGSDTRRFGGLGLGLSLVKRVAEAHGGSVEVESIPQKGSKFSIIIPLLPIE